MWVLAILIPETAGCEHEYTIDPQGREVRANFAAVVEVMTPEGPKRKSKFYPIFKAPPEIADQQFALDRKQALGTLHQMKLDFDSYNDNNEFGVTLKPLDLNFQRDIDEMGCHRNTIHMGMRTRMKTKFRHSTVLAPLSWQ